jgi:hypothetical protein
MKNLRIIAMTVFTVFCLLFIGSLTDAFAQGRSGKSKGKSSVGKVRSGDAIQRGIERMDRNRTWRNRDRDQDWRRPGVRKTNNGVRDHGRGIGRGKGQGKGRGYNKKVARGRLPF